jgi:copper(I)-binding protein
MKASWAAALLAAAMLFPQGAGLAHNYDKGTVSIRHPWMRAMTSGETEAAVYMEIRNSGGEADRLVAAFSAAAERVDIILTRKEGLVRREVGVLEIPARERLILKPKGSHLLFLGVARPLSKGERVPLTLRFERAGEVPMELEVQGLDSRKAYH